MLRRCSLLRPGFNLLIEKGSAIGNVCASATGSLESCAAGYATTSLQGVPLLWSCQARKRLLQTFNPLAEGRFLATSAFLPVHLSLPAQWSRSISAATQCLAPAEPKTAASQKAPGYDDLEITTEKVSAITDKIPQRPVGVVEGTSYSLLIIAAFGVLIYLLYQFVMNFILEPTAMQCFNHTLALLKADPRVTVRLGDSDNIRAWGSNSQSRVARQQIPHQIYQDAQGQEHVRVQFYMKGPSATALVSADMYKDSAGNWQYTYLLLDVYSGSSQRPSRVYIIKP